MILSDRLALHDDRLAIADRAGEHSYRELRERAAGVTVSLLAAADEPPIGLRGARVAVLCRPGVDWFAAVLGTWAAGGVVVPLHVGHPEPELAHPVVDAEVGVVLAEEDLVDLAGRLARRTGAAVVPSDGRRAMVAPSIAVDGRDDALIVHTSGTTGRPKGAVHTHASIAAQITGMVERWRWVPEDRTLCVLPLNHVHGVVNASLTPLWVGAAVEAAEGFDAAVVWERFASGELTLFMAVPTVYARLASAWDAADASTRARWSEGASAMRLMISGSAALPVSVLDRWRDISGHVLLERYGMTELGMVLGNTIEDRVPGHVGWPFPGVEVRVEESSGELLVRGANVFDRYWNRPDATAASFDGEWFRTGDVAVDEGVRGWRLLGRASVDILKTGGEKVSALEIEEVFRTHPTIADCAVVGLPDEEWGQRVAMAFTARPDAVVTAGRELRDWGKSHLAPAKVPVEYLLVDELPRNALGKVTKPDVVRLFDRSVDA